MEGIHSGPPSTTTTYSPPLLSLQSDDHTIGSHHNCNSYSGKFTLFLHPWNTSLLIPFVQKPIVCRSLRMGGKLSGKIDRVAFGGAWVWEYSQYLTLSDIITWGAYFSFTFTYTIYHQLHKSDCRLSLSISTINKNKRERERKRRYRSNIWWVRLSPTIWMTTIWGVSQLGTLDTLWEYYTVSADLLPTSLHFPSR
jgi:hypothetical protein